ncbi:hypothetical protein TNCV_200511 [Trichonephila clavipes]|nr:hypothetical protein TNCV_200511 [Trichonephila clavipes]
MFLGETMRRFCDIKWYWNGVNVALFTRVTNQGSTPTGRALDRCIARWVFRGAHDSDSALLKPDGESLNLGKPIETSLSQILSNVGQNPFQASQTIDCLQCRDIGLFLSQARVPETCFKFSKARCVLFWTLETWAKKSS